MVRNPVSLSSGQEPSLSISVVVRNPVSLSSGQEPGLSLSVVVGNPVPLSVVVRYLSDHFFSDEHIRSLNKVVEDEIEANGCLSKETTYLVGNSLEQLYWPTPFLTPQKVQEREERKKREIQREIRERQIEIARRIEEARKQKEKEEKDKQERESERKRKERQRKRNKRKRLSKGKL